ncbi:MAG: hypothetical protein A2046_13405 [Bacteroidetes bacterium GWA2_30_7]|nr:MAG: hypothetical protein A2046_13405 [Bacteroidetes bacterium GWA2_30_7]
MLITQNMKMADVIHLNYKLLPVINRFEIELGFGDSTVEEVCKINKVNVHFFLEIVNAFNDKDYFPKKNLQQFSVSLIVNYLQKNHLYYISEIIPHIEKTIDSLCINTQNIILLKNFFEEYKKELFAHIDREENVVYPYVIEIEKLIKSKKTKQNQNKYSIDIFADEHDNIEDKLFDLKNIIIKYLPCSTEASVYNKILYDLFTLEKDLNDHSRIEEKVLIPKVRNIEKSLKNS